MARSAANRKYQLTINNPVEHGYTHDCIKQNLASFSGLAYWCMCDEIGEEGTPHTHVYMVFNNAVMFTTLQRRFYGAHIEPVNGNNQENRDYIRKEGKWLEDEKNDTNLKETFEESGELPPDKSTDKKQTAAIYEMIKNGASNYEILEAYPTAMTKLNYIEQTRQTLLAEKHNEDFRNIFVEYIWGESGVGKTSYVIKKFGNKNVYRITNYEHPFDSYKGQHVIVFEEFRSSLPITEMLNYTDVYPHMLPCRYSDKQACYSKVFIITNIPLERQYPQIQIESPETWQAFKRRLNNVLQMLPPTTNGIPEWTQESMIEG